MITQEDVDKIVHAVASVPPSRDSLAALFMNGMLGAWGAWGLRQDIDPSMAHRAFAYADLFLAESAKGNGEVLVPARVDDPGYDPFA